MQKNKHATPLWFLKYWPMWLGFGLMGLAFLLPHSLKMKIGRKLGTLLKRCLPKHRHIAAINLKLCFPEKSEQDRQKLFDKYFEYFGVGVMELATSTFASAKHLSNLIEVKGLEHVKAAHAQGRGVIITSLHTTNLFMTGLFIALQFPLSAVLRMQKDKVFNSIYKYRCKKFNILVIEKHNVHTIAQELRNNKIVLYLPDQDYGPKHSIFAPFFGVPTASITALPRLAALNQSIIIPAACYPRTDQRGYELNFYPPLENYPSNNIENDVIRINQITEDMIRKQPEIYCWYYKRFRTRPEGEKSFY